MADDKISEYTAITLIPHGDSLIDISLSDGAGGFDTRAIKYDDLQLEQVVAQKLGVDLKITGEVDLDWLFTVGDNKRVRVSYISVDYVNISNPTTSVEYRFNIDSSTGALLETFNPTTFHDKVARFSLEQNYPVLYTASNTINFDVVTAYLATTGTVDIRVIGTSKSV